MEESRRRRVGGAVRRVPARGRRDRGGALRHPRGVCVLARRRRCRRVPSGVRSGRAQALRAVRDVPGGGGLMAFIEDYGLIGDLQSAALVSRYGRVDWLCLPRFDSAAFFASLLGDDENGHWSIKPSEEINSS